jgi:hypothetical protein
MQALQQLRSLPSRPLALTLHASSQLYTSYLSTASAPAGTPGPALGSAAGQSLQLLAGAGSAWEAAALEAMGALLEEQPEALGPHEVTMILQVRIEQTCFCACHVPGVNAP